MNYEKEYKEALSRARNFKNGEIERELEIGVNIMEYVFPELKESEDEKIRKEIIQWINEFTGTMWRGHYKKDILSWLEKQGEQNLANSAKTCKDEPKQWPHVEPINEEDKLHLILMSRSLQIRLNQSFMREIG